MGFCEWLERVFIDGPMISRYAVCINQQIRNLGRVLVFVVYIITAYLSITSFGIILPYEQWYQPSLLLSMYSIVGVFLFINIMFHYYKARTLPAICIPAVPFTDETRWCIRCEHFKSGRTHHCGVCERCVLGMDHHCIWINQCVGAHNHRHFFLFIAYLTFASFLIVVAGHNTAYDHIFELRAEHSFCSERLDFAPLQSRLCAFDGAARNMIIFAYLLAFLLFLLVGFLTLWNCWLISKGFTYIDYLKHSDMVAVNPSYQNPLDQGLCQNWLNFLGLRRQRSFWRHVLLPSSHAPFLYDAEKDELLNNKYSIV